MILVTQEVRDCMSVFNTIDRYLDKISFNVK